MSFGFLLVKQPNIPRRKIPDSPGPSRKAAPNHPEQASIRAYRTNSFQLGQKTLMNHAQPNGDAWRSIKLGQLGALEEQGNSILETIHPKLEAAPGK